MAIARAPSVRPHAGSRSRRQISLAAAAVVVPFGAGIAGLLSVTGAIESLPPRACELHAGDASAAIAEARRCGVPIEDLSARTEWGQTFANPDGTSRLELSVEPRWIRATDGSWVAIDTALRRNSDGSFSAVAATMDARFSAGGAAPLVTLANGDSRVTLALPAELPAPIISGATATYPEIYRGVDLVLSATATGFTHVLVVKDATAATTPALRQIRYQLASERARIRATDQGGVSVVAENGAPMFEAGGAAMWDSASGAGEPSTAAGPGDHARIGAVTTTVANDALVLEPDAVFLASAQFPVFIDPVWTTPSASRWAYSNSANENNDLSHARMGRSPDSGAIYRPLFEFPVIGLAGARILSASFSIQLHHSWSCGPTPATLWRANGIVSTPKNPWANSGFGAYLDTQSAAANKDSCHTSAEPVMSFGGNLTGDLQNATNGSWNTYVVGLSAMSSSGAGESTTDRWKRFNAGTARLTVLYNRPPRTPSASEMIVEAFPCNGAQIFVNTTNGLTLRARLSDPENENIKAQWQVNGIAGQYAPGDSVPAAAGQFTTTIPAAAFTNGVTYSWTVRGNDLTDAGAFGPSCSFTVNNALPSAPVATSTELALGSGLLVPPPPPTAVVGQPGAISLVAAQGDLGIAGYYVGVAAGFEPQATLWIPAPNGVSVVVAIAPPSADLTNYLTVRAKNTSGQIGAANVYRFGANAGSGNGPIANDFTGDGRSDIVYARQTGSGFTVYVAATRANGTVFDPVAVFETGPGYSLSTSLLRAGDFNGDGRSDLALLRTIATGRIDLTILGSNGNQVFEHPAAWQSGAGWDLTALQVAAGDVTGDGLDDLIIARAEPDDSWKAHVLVSTSEDPTSFAFAPPAAWHTQAAGTGSLSRTIVTAGDVDGDSTAELIQVRDHGGNQVVVWVQKPSASGAGFDPPVSWLDSGANAWSFDAIHVEVGDFAGDAKADLLVVHNQGNAQARANTLVSDGTRFVSSLAWQSEAGAFDLGRAKLAAGNYAGDARADLAALYDRGDNTTSVSFLTSSGTTLGNPVQVSTSAAGALAWSDVAFGTSATNTNLAREATWAASSSAPDTWGWDLRWVNDGTRGLPGWSSWSNVDVPHTEWIEASFVAPRFVNRIDLYPRNDSVPGNGFPSNFTIDVWNGSRWVTVVTRTGYPVPAALGVHSFSFPTQLTGKVRVQGTGLGLMQFAEIEMYLTKTGGGTGALGTNVLRNATPIASSSAPEAWGWALRWVNDGRRQVPGWSSWSNVEVPHTEWLEFQLPSPTYMNRIDMYPRDDDAGGNGFPASFTVEIWNGSAWIVVASRSGYPLPASIGAHRFVFAPTQTSRIRIVGTGLTLMQFAEVEAYLAQ